MHPRVSLQFIGPIPHAARRAMRRLVAAAPRVTPIRHPIRVFIAPAATVQHPGGGIGFGCFGPCKGRPEIWMGGRPPVKKWVEAWLREVLAHELAHYEQFRDGHRLQERGVAVRTRTLVRRFKKEVSTTHS
jgi:hypothetical protein